MILVGHFQLGYSVILRNQAAASPSAWSWGEGADLVALSLHHFRFSPPVLNMGITRSVALYLFHASPFLLRQDSLKPGRNSGKGSDH